MRSRCQHGKGQFWGGNWQTIVNNRDTPRSSVQRRLNRSRCRLGCGLAWAESITLYMGGPNPLWEGAILVDRGAHCKVYAFFAVSCAKTTKPIHLSFRFWSPVGRQMYKFNRIRQMAPMCPSGTTHCRHLLNNIEPSVYGGDAPYGKLLWPLVIFGHAHLDSHTDSQAPRAEYCTVGIPHNTTIYTVSQKKVPTFKLSVTLSKLNRLCALLESAWNLLQN